MAHSPDFRHGDVLERATRAWRRQELLREEAETLSSGSRSRVLQAALAVSGNGSRTVNTGFRSAWRGLLWAAPVFLAVLLVVPIALRPGTEHEPADPVELRVAKLDGKVVFTIENGGRPHTVSRSENPMRFDSASAVSVTDGSFEDTTTDGPSLVFYKID